ncbi:MAG TPA: M20 family metallopeptidase [Phycisphaerae bacterium]|nr:M20 family metallopeptidase [Phycisphaerae bacterium]
MSTTPSDSLFADLDAIVARAVELRHQLHSQPEIAYQERDTSAAIQKELTRLGIPFQKGLAGGNGIVATIEGKLAAARTVALRADMDALPVTEETGLPYASRRPGVMHACGHDGHMAVLLGAAAVLKAHATQLSGTVKLIFQPAEEGGLGADRMCADGAVEGVDAIFGLHGWPGLKVGMVATRPGPLLASVDGFTIRIAGTGGHAAAPQNSVDPIVCAASIVQGLQSIVSRESDPNDAVVLTVSQINAGSAFNVIPDRAELSGTIRAISQKSRESTLASLERIARGIAAAFRCEASFQYFGTTPVTANTPEMAAFIQHTAQAVLGHRAYVEAPKPAMWGEDFAFYLQHIPGCFFVLGVQPIDKDSYPMLHNPRFDFNDAAIPVGIRMMAETAARFLARQSA